MDTIKKNVERLSFQQRVAKAERQLPRRFMKASGTKGGR